jgi:hypothetical protein
MTRLFTAGAEAGTTDVFPVVSEVTASTVQKRNGAYSFLFAAGGYVQVLLSPGPSELYLRFGVYPTSYASTQGALISLYGSGTNHQALIIVDKTTGIMRYWRVSDLATGTHPLALNAWQCIEVYVKIADSGGRFVVKLDGVTDIDYTGDTRTTDADITTLWFMYHAAITATLGYMDDLAINDTAGSVNNSWVGRGGVYVGLPEEAGTYTDLHASTGNAWDCINEVPPDDADYVSDDTVDQKSTYGMSAITPATGTIACINVIMRAKLDAAGTGNIARLIRSNAVDSQGSDVGLDVSAKMIQENIETDPGEVPGTAWTIAAVNALEAGAVVR